MASTYYLIETADDRGGWGANFIIKWKSANKVTQPLIEAIHSGTHHGAYIFSTRGWPIKGVYE